MRLIDADALADWVLFDLYDQRFDALTGRQAANLIGKAIDESPTVYEWVSVNDRLPENGTNVLVLTRWDNKAVWEYDGDLCDNYCWVGEDYIYRKVEDVRYWMPLPEPPKGEI